MTGETEKRICAHSVSKTSRGSPRGEHFGARVKTLANSDRDNLRLGVHIEELPPRKQSSPFHYHLHEEEHFLILEGEVTLRFGEERILLKKGDFVTFPAGQKLGHCFINEGTEPVQYLIIGEAKNDDISVYPDLNKISVLAAEKDLRQIRNARVLGRRVSRQAMSVFFAVSPTFFQGCQGKRPNFFGASLPAMYACRPSRPVHSSAKGLLLANTCCQACSTAGPL